ncbi:MAG: protein convertase [Gammaproteobacteria bacterium]|nr:protein convertase [Gammaproteobacteria bacterium]
MANTLSKSAYIHTLDWLVATFPNAFSRKPKEIKPLKIGILEDIYEHMDNLNNPEFSKQDIKQAIQFYSSSPMYLGCQKEDAARVDLFGQEVDIVNHEQAKYAQQRYEQKQLHKQAAQKEKED